MEGGVAGDKVGERWVKGGEGRRRDKGNVIQHTSYGETEKPEKKMCPGGARTQDLRCKSQASYILGYYEPNAVRDPSQLRISSFFLFS